MDRVVIGDNDRLVVSFSVEFLLSRKRFFVIGEGNEKFDSSGSKFLGIVYKVFSSDGVN